MPGGDLRMRSGAVPVSGQVDADSQLDRHTRSVSSTIDSPVPHSDLAMSVNLSDPPPTDSGESSGTNLALAAEIAQHVVAALQPRESPSTSRSNFYVLPSFSIF